jgi:hypothetical protein
MFYLAIVACFTPRNSGMQQIFLPMFMVFNF